MSGDLSLSDIRICLEGVVPAVVATASADGVPNITYLSKVHYVDGDHIALSNQFFSKTSRNLAENDQASALVVAPDYQQFRLTLRYERTERRGPVFDALVPEIQAVANLHGMQDVFRLRGADIYRVVAIERHPSRTSDPIGTHRDADIDPLHLGELSARLSRCGDLDSLVGTALEGLEAQFGYAHSMLLLADERGERLYTIASHGYERPGVGSEVAVGEGVVGMAVARAAPMRVGNLHQMRRYSATVRRAYEEEGAIGPGREIPLPGLRDAESQLAVPAMVRGQVVGVLAVESTRHVAFDERDEALLVVVAGLVASAIEVEWAHERAAAASTIPERAAPTATLPGAETTVRHFTVDGSTFLDNDYLIKGVAGRILYKLLTHYTREGREEFTNREIRLDPALELPDLRDNLESRLILLKRRLEERDAPIRLEKTGRGRFRLVVSTRVRLQTAETEPR